MPPQRYPSTSTPAMIALSILFTGLVTVRARACSPAGHAFVAIAAVQRLQQAHDPEVRKLAQILQKYRWVVYHAAEGPDVVQGDRGYHASHWFPLYTVNYEHPERFDLAAAQPYFSALFQHVYRLDYGVTPDDTKRFSITLARQPRPEWREVSLAYACGYTTHLLADYFCHAPAKVWWDHEPKLKVAVEKICHEDSYGVIQEFYAVMLWERFAKTYGLPADPVADYRRHLGIHHVDNGVLPYCALAGSKPYYGDWPARAREAADPSKYDGCATHMLHRAGPSAGDCVAHESRRVHAMLDQMRLPFEQAVETSQRLTHWQETYDRVINMIVTLWTRSAASLKLSPPDEQNVVLAEADRPNARPLVLLLGDQPGAQINLAPECGQARAAFRTRKGETGPVTQWGKPPSGARFQTGTVAEGKRRAVAILTDGPWLLGAGEVRGTFSIRLPHARKLAFHSTCGLVPENTARSDGVTFRVAVRGDSADERELFARHLLPGVREAVDVDLSPWAGREIELILVADSGPRDNPGWDLGCWITPRVCVVD